ncbi:hypothetical protein DV735_g1403, partial [Chaetothyriales sp. CBS 134920]
MWFKPAGMHKHFRMMAIRNYMINAGVVSADDTHTSTSGIWSKLGTLDEFEEMMWERRLAPDVAASTSSPALSRRESTVAETDEPRSSPVSARAPGAGAAVGGGKSGGGATLRGSARKSGRLSKLQSELETAKSVSRRTSKAGSAVEDEDQEMGDAAEADEDDEGSGDDAGEENGQAEEKKAPSTAGKRETRSTPRARTRRARRK